MNAFVRWSAVLLGSATLLSGCSDRCEALCETCLTCPDSTYRKSCLATFGKGNQGVCSADVAVYRSVCGGTTSSTAASGASTEAPTEEDFVAVCKAQLETASATTSSSTSAGGGTLGQGGAGGLGGAGGESRAN